MNKIDKVKKKLNAIKNTTEGYPAGKMDEWDLDKLDADLGFICGTAEDLIYLLATEKINRTGM